MRAVSHQAPLPGDVRSVTAAPQLPAAARHSPPRCARTGEDAARRGRGCGAVISVDIEFKCCLIAFRQAFIILDASMDRHCQKSAWCQLYSSISNLTSVTNEVRYCVFCGNKTSQYIESSARPHCSSQPPAKYFISEPLDGSVSVKLFSFERRITMPARQQTNKNLK